MIRLLKSKGLLWPLILSLIGVTVLVMLGNWQMQRKVWKQDLIRLVEDRVNSTAISFEVLKQWVKIAEDVRFQPVKISGTFDHSQERHYFLPHGDKVGWHVITPLTTISGDVVLIDRGFVPDQLKAQEKRRDGLPEGQVEFEGLVRLAETPNYFTPANDVAHNKWYWRDIDGLYQSLNVAAAKRFIFMIDQRMSATSGAWPMPGVTRVKFSDKHLGYALTWYGLALTLVGVFAFFAYGRMRQ